MRMHLFFLLFHKHGSRITHLASNKAPSEVGPCGASPEDEDKDKTASQIAQASLGWYL